MPNAAKRVLVDFGCKGLYNYAVDTQLVAEAEEAGDAAAFECGTAWELKFQGLP